VLLLGMLDLLARAGWMVEVLLLCRGLGFACWDWDCETRYKDVVRYATTRNQVLLECKIGGLL